MGRNSTPCIPFFCLLNTVKNKTLYRCVIIMFNERFFNQILNGFYLYRIPVFAQFIYIGFDFRRHLLQYLRKIVNL